MKKIYHLFFSLLFFPVIPQAQLDTVPYDTDTLPLANQRDFPANAVIEKIDTVKGEASVFVPISLVNDSFVQRRINEETVKAQQSDKEFWYANYSFKKAAPKDEQQTGGREPLIFKPAFEVVLWIIVAAGFLLFLFLFLSNGSVGIFRSRRFIKEDAGADTTDFDDIFSIDYRKEIDKAAAAGNYNFAVRLLYLRLLRQLAEKNIIDYKQDLTNFDYLMQLQQTTYYKEFFWLTRHYEYSWYGQFPLGPGRFDTIRQQFESFGRI